MNDIVREWNRKSYALDYKSWDFATLKTCEWKPCMWDFSFLNE
jgi:hypothetical protein